MSNADLEFSSPEAGKLNFNNDECEMIIPNPSGGPSAVIIVKREQITQYIDDRLDIVEFNFELKLTEAQMRDMQEQWNAGKNKKGKKENER